MGDSNLVGFCLGACMVPVIQQQLSASSSGTPSSNMDEEEAEERDAKEKPSKPAVATGRLVKQQSRFDVLFLDQIQLKP